MKSLSLLFEMDCSNTSFTAEEAWQIFNPQKENSLTIFTEVYTPQVVPENAENLLTKWSVIREIRQEVTKSIEIERAAGSRFIPAGRNYYSASSRGKSFPASSAKVEEFSPEGTPLAVAVRTSSYLKCDRCWHYRSEVGQNTSHPTLCSRCDENLFGNGEKRIFA
jgi:isoleucyl-tRNA synthetase